MAWGLRREDYSMFRTSLSRHYILGTYCHRRMLVHWRMLAQLGEICVLYKLVLAFEIRIAGKQHTHREKKTLKNWLQLPRLTSVYIPHGVFQVRPVIRWNTPAWLSGHGHLQSESPLAMLCLSFPKPPCHILHESHKLGWPQRSPHGLGDMTDSS